MTQIHGNTTLIQLGTNAPLLLRNDVDESSVKQQDNVPIL